MKKKRMAGSKHGSLSKPYVQPFPDKGIRGKAGKSFYGTGKSGKKGGY